ncbi:MAG: DUF1493 family protein [Saprospiraceae bacterium]|nr:DUF1493 family protein [Candidatus Brachybacter algidus]MBL0118014.1 DUF1493 family protein [Candidatus Brachybacter algidus]
MNNYQLTDIISFVAEGTVSKKVYENSDIDRDLRWTGDDFDELMEKYAQRYQVDMSSYLWYFHHAEEGNNFGSAFFRAPNELVEHIPVTPKLLFEFAQKGKWDLDYPEHTLPKRRYDLIANGVFWLVLLLIMIWYFIVRRWL